MLEWSDFEKIDMRVGRIVEIQDFPEARNPSYKLKIDFGKEIGIKKSAAQITELYKKEDLLNRLVVCVVNFKPKQIANFVSECLVMGAYSEDGVVLLKTDKEIKIGSKIG